MTPIQQTFSEKFDLDKARILQERLKQAGFDISFPEGTVFRAKKLGTTCSLYNSGKIVVQGTAIGTFLQEFLDGARLKTGEQIDIGLGREHWEAWIGTDESGKGDYFGPLIIAGVRVERAKVDLLRDIGVADSKKISDTEVEKIAEFLRNQIIHNVVVIGPEKYNELYKKMRNVNKLLAWGHARVIENILEKGRCLYALTDQFGDERYVKKALMEKGKTVELHQEPKAESDIAVAAASILARNDFLSYLKKSSRKYNMKLPKGASKKVENAARDFVKRFGEEELEKIAKLHFRTTDKVLTGTS